jgi:hypothetical protein
MSRKNHTQAQASIENSTVSTSKASVTTAENSANLPTIINNRRQAMLTEATLALNHQYHVNNPSVEKYQMSSKSLKLQQAARELGFELPDKSLARETWEADAWVGYQSCSGVGGNDGGPE